MEMDSLSLTAVAAPSSALAASLLLAMLHGHQSVPREPILCRAATPRTVAVLFSCGVDTSHGYLSASALMRLLFHGNEDAAIQLMMLIDPKELTHTNLAGNNVFNRAVFQNRMKWVKAAIEYINLQAALSTTEDDREGWKDFLKLLLNHQNRTGRTVLMEATVHGSYKMAELLLDHGADPYATDVNELTFVGHACKLAAWVGFLQRRLPGVPSVILRENEESKTEVTTATKDQDYNAAGTAAASTVANKYRDNTHM